MRKSGIYLFKLFGFEVRMDWSWLFLGILVAWTLAAGYFPAKFPNLSQGSYWMMGLLGTMALFFSIILHELCHSLVGRLYGIPIAGITLFIFGGVAEMREALPSPKAEFLMAIAGPAFSLFLGAACYFIFLFAVKMGWNPTITGFFDYMGIINLALGVFNLLPGFPLDGGRVLRALLWWWKKDLKWATRVAASGGTALGIGLIVLGVFQFIQGAIIVGIWSCLLGLFLQQLARMSYQEMLVREYFEGKTIKKYTKAHPIAIDPNMSIQNLVENYFYKDYHKLYPVIENEKLVGIVSPQVIKPIPKRKWSFVQVKQIMHRRLEEMTVDANTPVLTVFQMMTSQKITHLLITENEKLYGIITLNDLINAIDVKLNLEEDK